MVRFPQGPLFQRQVIFVVPLPSEAAPPPQLVVDSPVAQGSDGVDPNKEGWGHNKGNDRRPFVWYLALVQGAHKQQIDSERRQILRQ